MRRAGTHTRARARAHTHPHTHTPTHTHSRTHARTHARTRTHAHARTHTTDKHMHYWRWVGRMRRKETTAQYAEEKRWVFSFGFKEESEDECLTERGRKFQSTSCTPFDRYF